MVKAGIVGLPNVGKSTLFNALLKKRVALSANYPFATIEPNIGVVAVPDARLSKLGELVKEEEHMDQMPPLVPAVVEFVDIAGLVKGASTGAGLGNQFLSHIREVDAILHVIRDFEDVEVIREGSISPDEDKLTIEIELGLADLQTIEKVQSSKFPGLAPRSHAKGGRSGAGKVQSDNLKFKVSAIEKIRVVLNAGQMANAANLTDDEQEVVRELHLLTLKPILYAYNVSEAEYADKLRDSSLITQNDKFVICAKVEEELADLTEEERIEYLKELGIEETGLERLIKKAYFFLGLISFLTAGKKEVRAWTIKRGTKAPQAAGVIHTDFEKKFIRAEVVEYGKLIEAGSHSAAKTKGWVRTEGKDYIMQDGDVVEFLIGS
ncbi:redox-regulated ATPase YchF [Candidatus Daviesbacteria bacterium RIFCSPHIGHO2_02_FULL_39_12]|uniref:Ribosome-binding ATPase YchF n=1 Tax=Candidatus Daviesbacteria bacterium RIFCSPHIGHO2_02_FULL_39_12 TaxID=1797770 RepID=A0A1F5J980_9BACT|nr:MAG: redox-regulated ATPase YchF [Candidatus Daviesbacteria bacterium RIFCSPHIGHO2_02_FULL_39_12]